MLEAILGAIPGFFEMFQKISKKSPSKQEYDSLRRMAAEALTMNACYYCNPVDIAQHGDKLPEAYERGSTQLRELGAKFRSFAETLPERTHDIPLSKEQIAQVGSNLLDYPIVSTRRIGVHVTGKMCWQPKKWRPQSAVFWISPK